MTCAGPCKRLSAIEHRDVQAKPVVPGQVARRKKFLARSDDLLATGRSRAVLRMVLISLDRLYAGVARHASCVVENLVADLIEKLPARSFGGAMFSIGDTKVRPRLGNKFTSAEKMGIYLQLYNFGPDATTAKPFGAIEYEIDQAGSNEKIMDFSEQAGSIPNASASQVTIVKMLPLGTFAPGTYTLKVTVIDRNGNQTVQRQGNFTVSSD